VVGPLIDGPAEGCKPRVGAEAVSCREARDGVEHHVTLAHRSQLRAIEAPQSAWQAIPPAVVAALEPLVAEPMSLYLYATK
jgi:hypothetical protein